MTKLITRTLQAAALTVAGFATTPSLAASEPTGLWYDDTGRGAVEITKCGANLCGKLVWLKDAANKGTCGTQIIGNVKPMGGGTWDGGWIYDPEDNANIQLSSPHWRRKLESVRLQAAPNAQRRTRSEAAPADLPRCKA